MTTEEDITVQKMAVPLLGYYDLLVFFANAFIFNNSSVLLLALGTPPTVEHGVLILANKAITIPPFSS